MRPAAEDGGLEFRVRANWKLAVENYCEAYHLPMIHPDLESYSRLADHYNIIAGANGVGNSGVGNSGAGNSGAGNSGAGQGSHAFLYGEREGIVLPGFPAWPAAETSTAEYITFFPNLLLALQVDHAYAVIVLPTDHHRTVETMRIFYVGEEPLGEKFAPARRSLRDGWENVFSEDVSVVEGMQLGRASPAFDGGVLSAVMDEPTYHFHRWVAARNPLVGGAIRTSITHKARAIRPTDSAISRQRANLRNDSGSVSMKRRLPSQTPRKRMGRNRAVRHRIAASTRPCDANIAVPTESVPRK